MPTAHRVACFRDDIVFLIYLYQRYLYPVDPNRVDTRFVLMSSIRNRNLMSLELPINCFSTMMDEDGEVQTNTKKTN